MLGQKAKTSSGMNLKDKNVLVMGLGRFGGGIGACRFLIKNEARVTVTDLSSAEKLAESVAQLNGLPITFHLGEHREQDVSQRRPYRRQSRRSQTLPLGFSLLISIRSR